jgi:hypothetical protein
MTRHGYARGLALTGDQALDTSQEHSATMRSVHGTLLSATGSGLHCAPRGCRQGSGVVLRGPGMARGGKGCSGRLRWSPPRWPC